MSHSATDSAIRQGPSTRLGDSQLAHRHLRGYKLRNYQLVIADQPLILGGPTNPNDLLAEPRVEQRFDEDDYMPYWSDLWPASAGMADYLLASGLRPQGPHRVAVEIGCGLGLAGVAAGMLGWHVIFTDYDVDALVYASYNAASNAVQSYAARLVDWRNPPTDLQADLVLGADILYEKKMHAAMLNCAWKMLRPTGVCLVADPRRDGAKGFADAACQTGFEVARGNWTDRQPGGHFIPIDLYFLRKPAGSP